MTIFFNKTTLFKRILCLLLIAIVLVMSIGLPYAQAVAAEIAVVAGAKELICAILIACGFEFARNEDARSVAGKVFDWLGDHAKGAFDKFMSAAQLFLSVHPSTAAGMRVSTDVFGALRDALVSFGFDPSVSGDHTLTWETASTYHFESISDVVIDRPPAADYNVKHISISHDGKIDAFRLETVQISDLVVSYKFYRNNDLIGQNDNYTVTGMAASNTASIRLALSFSTYSDWLAVAVDTIYTSKKGDIFFGGGPTYKLYSNEYTMPMDVYIGQDLSVVAGGTMAYPGEQTLVLAPPMPGVTTGEDGKEIVTYPPMSLNPDDHKKEIPLPPSGLVGDVPYDVPIDGTTGEVIEGEQSGEGEGTGGLWGWLKDLLKAILDAIKALVDGIVNGILKAFGWLKDLLQALLDAILGLVDLALAGLENLMKKLFVPRPDFFKDMLNKFLDLLKGKLPYDQYQLLLDQIANVGQKQLTNVEVDIMGVHVTIIDWSYYLANKPLLDNIIRGFIYVLLLFFNISQIHALLRNRTLVSPGKTDGSSGGSGGLIVHPMHKDL